jgi:hypothetical protein
MLACLNNFKDSIAGREEVKQTKAPSLASQIVIVDIF